VVVAAQGARHPYAWVLAPVPATEPR
jgi:hypothetical protein